MSVDFVEGHKHKSLLSLTNILIDMALISDQPPSEDGDQSPPATTTALAAPNPATSDRVLLDHRYFPHIIDLMLDMTTHSTLLVCAKVCRSWKLKAEWRLAKHVSVFRALNCSTGEYEYVFKSRDFNDAHGSVELWRNTRSGEDDNCQMSLSEIFRCATALDIYELPVNQFELDGDVEIWPLTFARIFSDREEQAPLDWIEERELYIKYSNPCELVCFVQVQDGHFYGSDVPTHSVRELTLNVVCHSNPATIPAPMCLARAMMFMGSVPSSTDVEQFTIILHDARETRAMEPFLGDCACCPLEEEEYLDHLDDDLSLSRCGCLGGLLLSCLGLTDKVKSITVVGAASFVPEADWPSYHQQLGDGVDEAMEYFGDALRLKGLMRFCSHEAYKAEVGEDRYQSLTVQ